MDAENPVHFATTKATSWRVVHGSLDDAVTCESSLSAVYHDADPAYRKGPLALLRPSPDSGPCEIKITFEQQHEIKQVYVKSTARVYEIYYEASQQDINEYLCTVRCGMAAKNEGPLEAAREVALQGTDSSKTESVSSSGSSKHLDEGEGKTDSGSSTNEDGWVEVKDLKSAVLDEGDDNLSGKTQASIQKANQDFYEATAEISDGNPCTSISLRLLSVQSGELVYIEEVYVFADPVLCDDEDSTPTLRATENSSSNSMMSMLVPTLLQLSKSRTSQPFSLSSTSNKTQRDATPSFVNDRGSISEKLGTTSRQPTQEVLSQPSSKEESSGFHEVKHSLSNVENKLDQLFLRVTKMEEFFSRFEEKMLNPITSMETRIQKVEQHLEELVNKNSTHSPNIQGTRITASDFCNASESPSLCNDEKSSSYCKADDCPVEEVPFTLSDESQTATERHLVPSLVVTAPDFECVDDEEDYEVTETVISSPKEIPRKHVSINDALASALAGFLSSTLHQDQATVCTPEVSSTDFPNDSSISHQEACLSAKCDDTAWGSAQLNQTSETSGKDSLDEGKHELPAGSLAQLNQTSETSGKDSLDEGKHELPAGSNSSEPTERVLESDHVLEERHPEYHFDSVAHNHFDLVENGSLNEEKIELEMIDESVDESLEFDHPRNSVYIHESGSNGTGDIAQKETEHKAASTSGKLVEGNSVRLPHEILGLPMPSIIDFKIPILDVQFAKQGDPVFKFSSLESLLTDDSKSVHESLCSQEEAVEKVSDATYPIEFEENKSDGPEATGDMLVDLSVDRSGN